MLREHCFILTENTKPLKNKKVKNRTKLGMSKQSSQKLNQAEALQMSLKKALLENNNDWIRNNNILVISQFLVAFFREDFHKGWIEN